MNYKSWLRKHISDVSRFSLGFLWDMLKGIGTLHTQGMLHRDLKHDNFLIRLTPNLRPQVVLTDFGLSGRNPERVYGYGNGLYRAPEGTVNEKSEIFAIGMIFATLLDPTLCHFNTPCSKSDSDFCSKDKHLLGAQRGKFRISEEIREKYPFEADLFKRMTSVDPNDRPTTDEVIKELDEYGDTWKDETDLHTRERKKFIRNLHL